MKAIVVQQSVRSGARTLALMLGGVLACAAPAFAARAQVVVTGAGARLQVSGSERDRVLARLDSLRREYGKPGLSFDERVRIGRQINREAARLDREDGASDATAYYFGTTDSNPPEMAKVMLRAQRAVAARASSRGWMGLNVEAPHIEHVEDGTVFVRYFDYPEVVSVDVNSPAEKAGVNRGDLLLAFDGQDVRDHEIDMTRLLVPGRRVRVTLRRDDGTKVLPVVVASAPAQVRDRRAMTVVLPPDPLPPDAVMAPMPPMMPMPSARPAPAPRVFVRAPDVPQPPDVVEWYPFDPARAPVAGARLASLNDGLVATTGTRNGVFVVEVAPSSPAARAGLRGGDVIVSAAGTPLQSIPQLRALLEAHADDQRLALTIVRARRTRQVTLRW